MRASQVVLAVASTSIADAASTNGRSSYHNNAGVLQYVNPKIGTFGYSPNGNGGMIPSVAPPFAMTRWTAQTRENFISQCPYHDADGFIHGFQATHQPAIWMGESGHVVLMPGMGEVAPAFQKRGLQFKKSDEKSTPYVYEVTLDADTKGTHGWDLTAAAVGGGPVPGGGQPVPDDVKEGANGRIRRSIESFGARDGSTSSAEAENSKDEQTIYANEIQVALAATSHVGHLRLDFQSKTYEANRQPFVFFQTTRQNWTGHVHIDPEAREVSGSNPERQDYKLGPHRAPSFSGYFVARFSKPFGAYGTSHGNQTNPQKSSGSGEDLGAYVKFAQEVTSVEVRIGVSFVSVEQARKNIDIEIPDGSSFESTVESTKSAWLDKIGRVSIEGVNQTSETHNPLTTWYTGLFHALQYPNDFSEPKSTKKNGPRTFYSGYTDSVHTSHDSYYQSWSIWDTYRAEHSLLTLFAPERVNSMMRSLLQIFSWAGRLPMWANVVETNIMIGTHVDAVLANALTRGFHDFDVKQAWTAIQKNAYVPPKRDMDLLYYDREPRTPAEVRAGLTEYMKKGYVPNDMWAESASRTLDYAFDDYAAAVVADFAGQDAHAKELYQRSKNYASIWNKKTSFMQARNANGTWASTDWGWTEGDDWVYTFDVMHDIPGLISLFGGKEKLKRKLDKHFDGGHNDHTNEPSHHVPYLYAAIGYPASTQRLVREIAWDNYNATSAGLGGNEDLGQMSAWLVFSALGFYPVNPASDEYIVGSPFFEKVTIQLPDGAATGGIMSMASSHGRHVIISAPGAPSKPYVKSLTIDGKAVKKPLLKHSQIVNAKKIEFEMASSPQEWGSQGAF